MLSRVKEVIKMNKTSGQISTWIIAGIAAVILVVVGVIFYLQPQKQDDVTVTPEQNVESESPLNGSDETSMMEDGNIQDFEDRKSVV